jgi:hypothetical protein
MFARGEAALTRVAVQQYPDAKTAAKIAEYARVKNGAPHRRFSGRHRRDEALTSVRVVLVAAGEGRAFALAVETEIERLVVRLARENSAGAMGGRTYPNLTKLPRA